MLTSSQSFKLYGIVQRYFNKEEDAQAFVSEIETAIDRKYEAEKDRLATKDDILLLKQDILKLQVEMKEQKAELIKWMFIFWIGQISATLAILLVFLKK